MKKSHPSVHVVVKYFVPVAAGIETNIVETYSHLRTLGWDVVVHTSTSTLTEYDVLSKSEVIRGIQVNRYQWRWYGFWPQDILKADIIALHNCNLVPHIPMLMWWGLLKLIGARVPTILVTPHGGFTPEWRTFSTLTRHLKYVVHRTIYAWLLNHVADGIRAVSQWEKQEMISYGIFPFAINVISNGIENLAFEHIDRSVSQEWKQRVEQFGMYLIQMGRIHPIKNFETTIKALAKLPEEVRFVIAGPVGDEAYKHSLESLIKKLGLAQRVVFVGVVRGAEKFYLIKKSVCMVHMAMWESYCNVVHEGMSQGKVCVVANTTALPYLIKDGKNGYCLDTFDHKALADRINTIIDNRTSPEILEIEARNRNEVKAHSWESVATRMHAWYTQMIQ